MKVKVSKVIDNKTFKATADFRKKHRYGKYILVQKKYLVDSRGQEIVEGSEVEIKSSRPISKNNSWILS